MIHTECKDCELSNGDCGHHFKMDGATNYDIASLSACDQYGNCMFFKSKVTMRLEEAIDHLEEMLADENHEWPCDECLEHEQLLGWLKELKGLRLENEVILRRLKHLLESDYISQFDQVNPNTQEYIRDIREADRKVMYLCDQEKPCKEHCEKDHLCKRTSDISHAKNFRLVPNGIYPIIFEEVDEHCIANVTFDREQLEKIIDERVIEPIKNGELVVKKEDGKWGKWVISEIRCPNCLGYFQTDCYSMGVLKKCPACGKDMIGGIE